MWEYMKKFGQEIRLGNFVCFPLPEQLRKGKKAHSLVPFPQAVAVRVDAVQRAAQAVRQDAAQLGDEQTPASQGELFQQP